VNTTRTVRVEASSHTSDTAIGTGARSAGDHIIAAVLALLAFLVYAWTDGSRIGQQSEQPHFVLLADALLHGHLWIDPARAARLGDITPFAGHFYVSFPPMPAFLMLPFVALVGPGFNDVIFTIVLGSLNVALTYLLVRRLARPGFAAPSGIPVYRRAAIAIAVLLGVGTVHFYATVAGTVWYTAHVVAVTFMLLYLIECAGRGRPLVAGTALAAAFLARTPTVLGGIFWLACALRRDRSWRPLASRLVAFAAPSVLALILLLGQNALRFGSPLDFGYFAMRIAPRLAPDRARYGLFSLHFLPRNLAAFLITPPIIGPIGPAVWLILSGNPFAFLGQLHLPELSLLGLAFPLRFDPEGTGLWAVSPALLFALRWPRARDTLLAAASWASTILVALPDLLYYNTGWYQYGYRFSLDFTPFLLILTALGLRRPLGIGWRALFIVLLIISVGSNFLGARWFLHLPPY